MWNKFLDFFTFDNDKNIVELFKPVYYLLSLTGLFPVTVKFPNGRLDRKIIQKRWYLHFFGALLMFAFLCSYFYHRIKIAILLNRSISTRSVSRVTYYFDIAITLLGAIVAYFYTLLNAKKYVKILRDIAFCWSDLSLVNASCILTYLRRLLIFPFIVWLIVFPSVQAALIMTAPTNVKVHIELIYFAVLELIPGSMVLLYCTMVLMVVGLMKNIDNHCQLVAGANKQRTKRSVGLDIDSTEIDVRRNEDDWVRVSQLEQAYEKVIEIKEEINGAFQAPVMIIVIQCFHAILTSGHTLYRVIMVIKMDGPSWIIHHCYWVAYCLAKVFAITYTETLLKDQEVNIGQTLHNIPTENLDNRMLIEIQHFSTLMSFRKPMMTIYNYFYLDGSLFYGMIATIVTYLVILVQFDSDL